MKNKYLIEEGTLLYTPRQLFTIFLDFLYLLNHIAITILRSVNAIMVDVIAMINHLKKIICYSLIKLKLNKLRLIDSHSQLQSLCTFVSVMMVLDVLHD